MPRGIVQQDKEVRLKRASKQTIHPPNNDINMPLLAEYKEIATRDAPFSVCRVHSYAFQAVWGFMPFIGFNWFIWFVLGEPAFCAMRASFPGQPGKSSLSASYFAWS
jgi:hypothetical protein